MFKKMRFKPHCLLLFICVMLKPALFGHEWTKLEKPILKTIENLRSVSDKKRPSVIKDLAIRIRALPTGSNKVVLANGLAHLSTEGDPGHDVLQEVATTLSQALAEHPLPDEAGEPAEPYRELAMLSKYERLTVSLDAPPYLRALELFEQFERSLALADFSLRDLEGKIWTLRGLQGKVVLLNFWASWCPPCVREMPVLQSLHNRFKDQGLVILGISGEDPKQIRTFAKQKKLSYPLLLDHDFNVHRLFRAEGIPRTFVYDPKGRLVSISIDMRTQAQLLKMLALAGIE